MSMTLEQAAKRLTTIREEYTAKIDALPPLMKDRTALNSIVEALGVAIAAIRKRTPTMVTHEASIYSCHTCPSCRNVVDESEEFVPGQKIRVQPQWCKFCGQSLKWEE